MICPSNQDINDLLHHSMRVQMATVRDTEFSDFILSDACISTAGLMFVYLKALGIESRRVMYNSYQGGQLVKC